MIIILWPQCPQLLSVLIIVLTTATEQLYSDKHNVATWGIVGKELES